MTVEGPSPVGFRSLIGNFFFSTEHTIWHMGRKFIMRVLILPIPVLVPAIFIEYLLYKIILSPQTSAKGRAHLFHPFRVMCYCCYCIHAFYFHFIIGKVNCTRSCVCEWDRESKHLKFIWTCPHQELPQRMLTLLRVFWNLFVSFWRTIMTIIREDIKNAKNKILTWCQTCAISVSFLLQFLRFNIRVLFHFLSYCFLLCSLATSPIVFSFLLSPIAVLCASTNTSARQLRRRYLLCSFRFVVGFLDICLACFAAIGFISVLKYAAVGIIIFLQLAVTHVLSKENLPFLTCFVLVCCYFWSSYRSFTQKYQDFAVKLFEQYDQLTESEHKTYLNMQGFTSDYGRAIDNGILEIRESDWFSDCFLFADRKQSRACGARVAPRPVVFLDCRL